MLYRYNQLAYDNQVLRYCFDDNSFPLYFSKYGLFDNNDVHEC